LWTSKENEQDITIPFQLEHWTLKGQNSAGKMQLNINGATKEVD
jgi:hypothetical protein